MDQREIKGKSKLLGGKVIIGGKEMKGKWWGDRSESRWRGKKGEEDKESEGR